jgi:hypothetical protein
MTVVPTAAAPPDAQLPPTAGPPDSRPPRSPVRSSNPRHRRILGLVVPLQLFLATGWLRAGIEKVIDPRWWSGNVLLDFLEEQRPFMLPWFGWFSDAVLAPLAPVVAWIVVGLQLAIAACLFANRNVSRALWTGILLNVCFTMAGRVNPSAFYLVMEMALLFGSSRPIGETVAVRRAVAWLIPAVLVAPFAHTLEPSEVIEDPALMLCTLGVFAALTTIAMSVPENGRSRAPRRARLLISRFLLPVGR